MNNEELKIIKKKTLNSIDVELKCLLPIENITLYTDNSCRTLNCRTVPCTLLLKKLKVSKCFGTFNFK